MLHTAQCSFYAEALYPHTCLIIQQIGAGVCAFFMGSDAVFLRGSLRKTHNKKRRMNSHPPPVERETGIEPATPTLARWCSTAEPLAPAPLTVCDFAIIARYRIRVNRKFQKDEPGIPAKAHPVLRCSAAPHMRDSLLPSVTAGWRIRKDRKKDPIRNHPDAAFPLVDYPSNM